MHAASQAEHLRGPLLHTGDPLLSRRLPNTHVPNGERGCSTGDRGTRPARVGLQITSWGGPRPLLRGTSCFSMLFPLLWKGPTAARLPHTHTQRGTWLTLRPTAASARGAKDFILLIGAGRGRRFVENHGAACRFRFLGGAGGRRDTETPLSR